MHAQRSLTDLGRSLDDAVESGHLGDEDRPDVIPLVSARARTAYRYLFLLDYLDQVPPDEFPTGGMKLKSWQSKIEQAIRDFQSDCGLRVDGELREAVWEALLDLASFDTPTQVSRWMRDGQPLPVMERAAKVRLYALGLCNLLPRRPASISSRNKEQQTDLRNGIGSFVRAARIFDLASSPLQPQLDFRFLNTLFDQAAILNSLARGTTGIMMNLDPSLTDRQRRKEIAFGKEFVNSVAAVELWLFGYDVLVGSGNDKGRFQAGDGKLDVHTAIGQFIESHAGDIDFTGVRKGKIPGLAFRRILEVRISGDDAQQTADADEVVRQVLEDRNVKSQVLAKVKTFGSRLWDGVKRVWRWFKSGLKKLFEKTKRIAKAVISNIARYVHSAAVGVFEHVRAAVRGVRDGFNFLREKVVRGSDPAQIVVQHTLDFDIEVFVNQAADQSRVRNFSDIMLLRSRIFEVATKIVGELFSLFLKVVRKGITTGWFGILLALTRLGKSVFRIGTYAREELELLDQLDRLEAQPV